MIDYRLRLKKPQTGMISFMAIVFVVASVVIFGIFMKDDIGKKIEAEGISVTADVVGRERIVRREVYTVRYQAESGEYIDAELVARSFPPAVGSKITGYVLPDEPNKFYSEKSKGLVAAVCALTGIMLIVGVWLIFVSIKRSKDYKLLMRNGISCDGKVGSVETIKGDSRSSTYYLVHFEYADENGNIHEGKSNVDLRPPQYGDICPVVYAKKSNGKYIAEIAK